MRPSAPEPLSVLDCLEMIHRSPGRLRYRVNTASPLSWAALEQQLSELLAGLPLYWRLNARARSVLLVYRSPQDGLSDGPDVADACLRQASQRLLGALDHCGATPMAATVIRIRTNHSEPAFLRRLRLGLINVLSAVVSAGASLLLVAVASLLILLGILGLMLPLAPGGVLLVLAFMLVELALRLRRPFVRA